MLKSISIRNFKQFQEINLKDLGLVTIIGGRNNTGKTSLLEAIYLSYAQSDNVFMSLNNKRRIPVTSLQPKSLWENYFYQYNIKNDIEIIFNEEEDTYSLTIKRDDSIKDESQTVALSDHYGFNEQVADMDKLNYPITISLSRAEGNVFDTRMKIADKKTITIKINPGIAYKDTENFSVKYLGAHFSYNNGNVVEEFSKLALKGIDSSLIKALKLIDPQIRDVRVINELGKSWLYGVIGKSKQLVPLSYMGDGINRLLIIMQTILSNPNGIVLIDELENGFHYTMHEKIWKMIAKLAKENNTQIIATTHSIECLNGVVAGTESSGIEDNIMYIRLENNKGMISPKYFKYDLIKYAIDSEIELR